MSSPSLVLDEKTVYKCGTSKGKQHRQMIHTNPIHQISIKNPECVRIYNSSSYEVKTRGSGIQDQAIFNAYINIWMQSVKIFMKYQIFPAAMVDPEAHQWLIDMESEFMAEPGIVVWHSHCSCMG